MKNKKDKSKSQKTQVEAVEEKIIRLQRATGTVYPIFSHWHTEMCRRSPLYYAWHKNPSAESVHWMILTMLVLYLLWMDSQMIFSVFVN